MARKICPNCREPVEVDPAVLQQVQLPQKYIDDPKFTIFHGKGCRSCNNTGYAGRMSIVEVFLMSDDIRKLVVQRKSADRIKAFAMEQGMLTLRMVALRKMIRGEIPLEEVVRVTSPDELEGVNLPESLI